MLVNINFDELDPPTGTAKVDDVKVLEFVGWLGLLRVLSELTAAAGATELLP